MKASVIIGVICALVLHAGFILFGGLLFPEVQKENTKANVVYLPEPVDEKEKPKDPEPPPEKAANTEEPPPDAEKVVQNMEADSAPKAPAMELASLAAINDALNGKGGGDGGNMLSFNSGGVVGGTGKFGSKGSGESDPFDMNDLDQKPRAVFQASPVYPAEMRGRKIEGVVSVWFVVDPTGKVIKQRLEKSNNEAFVKPALDAVRQWKFEPALKSGQRVACKMRVSVRFPAS